MAEIIRQGKLPTEKWFHATCSNCNTHFKFQKKEIKSSGDQRDGYYNCISCPFCNATVFEPSKGSFKEYIEDVVSKRPTIQNPEDIWDTHGKR